MGGFGICAVSGSVEETPYDKTPDVGLMYADETYWKQMMAPARERVTGSYPVREDEVMVTEEALEKCGFQGLGIGDAFTVTCSVKGSRGSRPSGFRESGTATERRVFLCVGKLLQPDRTYACGCILRTVLYPVGKEADADEGSGCIDYIYGA